MTEPHWLKLARNLVGTREAPGPANDPTIMGWAKRAGGKVLGILYNADSVPWCGLFVANCMLESGIQPPLVAVRARSWATWGLNLRPDRLAPGAVLVFGRVGGGHVAFYVGEDSTHFHVLGGNQGDKVSIMRIEKQRLIASRWPEGEPVTGKRVAMSAPGIPVSRNEA
jgi:uncharacterized protein (TIGR02594 family)